MSKQTDDNIENDDASISSSAAGVLFYFMYFVIVGFLLMLVFVTSNNEYEWMLDEEGIPDDFVLPEDDEKEIIYVFSGLGLILITLNLLWINLRPKTSRFKVLLIVNLIIAGLFVYRMWSYWQSRL